MLIEEFALSSRRRVISSYIVILNIMIVKPEYELIAAWSLYLLFPLINLRRLMLIEEFALFSTRLAVM